MGIVLFASVASNEISAGFVLGTSVAADSESSCSISAALVLSTVVDIKEDIPSVASINGSFLVGSSIDTINEAYDITTQSGFVLSSRIDIDWHENDVNAAFLLSSNVDIIKSSVSTNDVSFILSADLAMRQNNVATMDCSLLLGNDVSLNDVYGIDLESSFVVGSMILADTIVLHNISAKFLLGATVNCHVTGQCSIPDFNSNRWS